MESTEEMNGSIASDDALRRIAGLPSEGPANWRTLLVSRALRIWQTARADDPDQFGDRNAIEAALADLTEDAIALIDAFAIGVSKSSDPPVRSGAPPAAFSARLDILLNGLEGELAARADASLPSAHEPPHVIQSELWQLLRKTRESAELSYAREFDLIELDRRILFLLRGLGPLVPAEVSSAVGVDKAQVSRSVKRLLELRLVEREQIRAPLILTRKGDALGKRLMRLAELRNRELTFDVSDDELREFFATIETLLDRAVALYEEERELAQPGGKISSVDSEDRKAGERVAIDRSRIVSPLMTLSSYFSRSGALAFKRLTGLSNFEAFVLSEIGMDPPIDWSELVSVLERDHSQAGRTIKALTDRGLIEREGRPGRRHGRFFPTEEGTRLHRIIHQAGAQRSAFLLAPLGRDQRSRFLATFEKIRRNAVAQLERERAFAELDR